MIMGFCGVDMKVKESCLEYHMSVIPTAIEYWPQAEGDKHTASFRYIDYKASTSGVQIRDDDEEEGDATCIMFTDDYIEQWTREEMD